MVSLRVKAWGVSLLLLACGGRSSERVGSGVGAPSDASETSMGGQLTSSPSGDAGEPSASGTGAGGTSHAGTASGGAGDEVASIGGAAGDAGGSCPTAPCQLPAEASPLWVTTVEGYGRGPAAIRFSENDDLVRVAAGESTRELTVINRVTGELAPSPPGEQWMVAEDASGRRVARLIDGGYLVSLDGTETFRVDSDSNTHLQFSPDGAALAELSCVSQQEDLIQVDVYETSTGQLLATARAELPCVYGDVTWLVDAQHRRTLFGHPARSELFVLDWDSQSIITHAIHESASSSAVAPRNHEGTILNLGIAPNGQALVSVGAVDGLAWLDPDTLAVEHRLPEVPFFNVYDKCYCTYLSESPVAWSRAGDIYATSHRGGGIALRDVATHEQLSVLHPPQGFDEIRLSLSSDFGPVLIAFSPDGRHLVALYPGVAVGYSL